MMYPLLRRQPRSQAWLCPKCRTDWRQHINVYKEITQIESGQKAHAVSVLEASELTM